MQRSKAHREGKGVKFNNSTVCTASQKVHAVRSFCRECEDRWIFFEGHSDDLEVSAGKRLNYRTQKLEN